MMPVFRLSALIVILILSTVPSQSSTADDMAVRMHRGMNVLDDDSVLSDPARGRFQPRLFTRIRDAGFDTVRLNLHPFAHLDQPGWFAALDRMTKAGLAADLTVILDVHEDQTCARDLDACRRNLRTVWSALATRYRGAPDRLLFEILNEPHGAVTIPAWNNLLREMLGLIRATNPERNIVIGPGEMNGMDRLPSLDLPESDRHIIVTVHTYTPVAFTLQGAPWVPEANRTDVTWGSDADSAQMVKMFDRAKAWSDTHRRPVFLGEFGVYYKVPMDGRVRWLSSVARIAEAHGFAWAYWQFDTDFAVYDIKRDSWIDPVLKALVP
jgi:endoglucanase